MAYKLYAVEAGVRGIATVPFVRVSFAVRLARFALTTIFTALIVRILARLHALRWKYLVLAGRCFTRSISASGLLRRRHDGRVRGRKIPKYGPFPSRNAAVCAFHTPKCPFFRTFGHPPTLVSAENTVK